MRFESGQGSARRVFLFDPQTSGGLLIAIPADRADDLVQRCRAAGFESTARIGAVVESGESSLIITD